MAIHSGTCFKCLQLCIYGSLLDPKVKSFGKFLWYTWCRSKVCYGSMAAIRFISLRIPQRVQGIRFGRHTLKDDHTPWRDNMPSKDKVMNYIYLSYEEEL